MNNKIVLLGTDCDSTWIVANYLNEYYHIKAILIEEKVSKSKLIKNRIKRLGYLKVLGQLCFQVFLYPIILSQSLKRINQICHINNLNRSSNKLSDKITDVKNVNAENCIDLLASLDYDVVVINGTRILSKKLLKAIKKPIINTHVGITPKYRGVHGAYWALANDDKENCGVTVHLVDMGIDTGEILYQAKITPLKQDNFATYPYLQIAEALPLLKEAIIKPTEVIVTANVTSKLWYHPTIFDYLINFIFKSTK